MEDTDTDGFPLPRFEHVHDHDRRVGDAIGDVGRRPNIHEGTRRRFIPTGEEIPLLRVVLDPNTHRVVFIRDSP
jgi:hypothetical protein